MEINISGYEARFPNACEIVKRVTSKFATNRQLPNPFPGEFRVCRVLGDGAFARVYLAEDLHLDRPVALKTLKLIDDDRRHSVVELLKADAKHLATIDHPNIVRVYSWRDGPEAPYLVLQYVPGMSLADRIRIEGRMRWDSAIQAIADIGEALQAVHALGIVHRDLKPANILWHRQRKEALLTDFGVAARLGDGSIAGTPQFMAPEAFDGQVSPAVDVYGLGATLFNLLAGSVPFTAKGSAGFLEAAEILRQQIKAGLSRDDERLSFIPEEVHSILRSSLETDPRDRPTLEQFVSKLRATLNHRLADTLIVSKPAVPAAIDLRIHVSRISCNGQLETLETQPVTQRDIKLLPPQPERIRLHAGDRLQIAVSSNEPGYVTVFNIGPTGNLNLLTQNSDKGPSRQIGIARNQRMILGEAAVSPPAGKERLVGIWSRQPIEIPLSQLKAAVTGSSATGGHSYRATRDIKRVQQALHNQPSSEWRSVVIELDHQDR